MTPPLELKEDGRTSNDGGARGGNNLREEQILIGLDALANMLVPAQASNVQRFATRQLQKEARPVRRESGEQRRDQNFRRLYDYQCETLIEIEMESQRWRLEGTTLSGQGIKQRYGPFKFSSGDEK